MLRRLLAPLLALLTIAPAAAEFGPYGTDGWPINIAGQSTNPFPGVTANELEAAFVRGDPLNQVAGLTVFPYYPLLLAEVQRLATDHPDRVKLHSAGKSTLGLDLWMLEIADFAAIDAGTGIPLAERETVWVDGGTHSNEYSGAYFALAWAQFLVEEYDTNETAKWLVENRHSYVMPMVNPDGSNLMGRLNANRVNINRNYPVIWDGQGHDELLNNRGPSPASEVETQINIEWFNITRPDYYASIHCCGNLWLYPYGEEGIDPIDMDMLSRVCDEAFSEVRADCGPIWSTIYPASGSSVDTAYEYAGAVAFGYEMSGRGAVAMWGQPVTNEAVQVQEFESWQGLMHAALHVHRYGAYPVIVGVRSEGENVLVTLRNDGLGNLTEFGMTLRGVNRDHQSFIGMVGNTFEPGETQEFKLYAAGIEPGAASLSVEYPKRLVSTTNIGVRTVPLLITDDASAAAPEGGFLVEPLSASPADQAAPATPPLAGLLLVALLAALVARRR